MNKICKKCNKKITTITTKCGKHININLRKKQVVTVINYEYILKYVYIIHKC